MYGAKPYGSRFGISGVRRNFLGGGTFSKEDLVLLSSGEVAVGTAGATNLLGVALEAGTSSSTDVEVDVTPGLMVIMDNDNDGTTFGATHPGTKFDLIGATGAMQIDTSTTTTQAQLLCWEYNPQIGPFSSDVSIGLFQLDETVYRV